MWNWRTKEDRADGGSVGRTQPSHAALFRARRLAVTPRCLERVDDHPVSGAVQVQVEIPVPQEVS